MKMKNPECSQVRDSASWHHRETAVVPCRCCANLLGCFQLELSSLAMTGAIPKYTLLQEPHLSSAVVMGTDCWTSVMNGVHH